MFKNLETENQAKKDEVIYPRPYSWVEIKLGIEFYNLTPVSTYLVNVMDTKLRCLMR
jgi:hypothetical protein